VIITEIQDTDLQSRLGNSGSDRTRDKLHVSEIYKILMQRLQPARFNNSKPMDMRRIEIGLLFENMLERALAEKFATVRPGELVSGDGTDVYMSPDGVNPALLAGEEYKATYMSSRGGLYENVIVDGQYVQQIQDKFYHWVVQMLAYAKWLDVNDFILRVLFVCGDYSRPITPEFKSYRFKFTEQEKDENWAMLIQIAREEGLL
jgi:hypothetical protein